MGKNKEKPNMFKSFTQSTLHVAQAVSYTQPLVKIAANGEIFIENCRQILAYDENQITFQMGTILMDIKGDGLLLKSMSSAGVLVAGRVHGIHFSYL